MVLGSVLADFSERMTAPPLNPGAAAPVRDQCAVIDKKTKCHQFVANAFGRMDIVAATGVRRCSVVARYE